MIIKRLELVNYCQHVHREILVSGNLIAVVGHNGVGKSNMLGALQFVLTGEQPDKTKAELLHWGAKEGHVILEFEQDGKPGRIERSVSSNKVTLEYDGVTTSGITNVAKEMETRLHMDKDLVKQSVFVRQTEVDAIISAKTDKRDREVAFQKLLGIDAAKIHKNLTDWLYNATKPVSYDIQLAEASQRLGDTETRKSVIEDEVKKAEAAVAEFGEVDESQTANLSKAIASVSRVLQGRCEVEACDQNVAARAKALEDAKAAAMQCGANPGYDLAALTGQEAVLLDELRKIKAKDAATAALQQAQESYDRAQAQPHPTEEAIAQAQAAADTMQAELASVQSEKAIRTKSLAALNGAGPSCPVCGKPLDAGMVERMQAECDALAERERELGPALRNARDKAAKDRADLSSWTQGVAVAQSRLEAARSGLAACEASELTKERAESVLGTVRAEMQAQRDYDAKATGHKKAVADAELALAVASKSRTDAAARLEEAEAEAKKLCGDEAAADWTQAQATMESLVAETDRRRATLTQLKLAVARAAAARDEVVRSIATLSETVTSLKRAQAEQDELAKRLHAAERVKDWFHYANGPRVLVTQVLGVLTDDVNRFLGNFTAPFVVVPDPDQVGFRVQFTDGRDCPPDPPGTNVLSGGERVQLAVAFRLAIYSMFAGKLGLLSLDEPTAYLDDSNVDRFGVLLTKVREIARNMNTQVFMATHERAVIPHMDSVIDLN
jgi:DNA repair exonuclease SbcCD ATPase subunit